MAIDDPLRLEFHSTLSPSVQPPHTGSELDVSHAREGFGSAAQGVLGVEHGFGGDDDDVSHELWRPGPRQAAMARYREEVDARALRNFRRGKVIKRTDRGK